MILINEQREKIPSRPEAFVAKDLREKLSKEALNSHLIIFHLAEIRKNCFLWLSINSRLIESHSIKQIRYEEHKGVK